MGALQLVFLITVRSVICATFQRKRLMDKNQKKAFTTLFVMFVFIIALIGNATGVFQEIEKSGLMLVGLFVSFCAFPFYFFVKTNKEYIRRLYKD